MELTPGQIAASTIHDRALVVEAGAGTGKTHTLVGRFLRLLEQHPDWSLESLVAVTFTEKAAREMRTRLHQAISARAQDSPSDSTWQERRRALERLQVFTIHGLCARILRENAIAAGLDPRFDVMDEQQSPAVMDQAVRQALAELVETDDPALALLAGLEVRDLQRQLTALLNQRGTLQQLFDQLPPAGELIEGWRQALAGMRKTAWEDMLARTPGLEDAMQRVREVAILDEVDVLADSVRAARTGCQFLDQGDLIGAMQTWLTIKLKGGKSANWGGKDELENIREDLKTLRASAKQLEKYGCLLAVGELDEQAAQALQLWGRLWRHTTGVYDHLKAVMNALDFDDLELLTERLLNQQPRDPRLQNYLDGLNQLMVDEFQDTNETQQRIVYALAHPGAGGCLFLVGDAKQSIYRFRQAQVSVFNRTAREIQEITGHAPVRLDKSFRSHQALVDAQNYLFERILQPLGSEHAIFEAQPGPLQAVRPTPATHPAAPAPVELWILPAKDQQEDSVSAEDARSLEARLLAERLHELYTQAYPVWDKRLRDYRPFQYRDAAILFRATTSLPLYEGQFKEAGLPYLTVSGRGYFDRPEVRDLVVLLTALQNPGDDLSLAAALRSPLFNLNDETLYRLRWHTVDGARAPQAIPYIQALADPPPNSQPEEVAFADQTLSELRQEVGWIDPWRLLRKALDLTGYEAALALNDADLGGGGRQRSNMLKLLEIARQRHNQDLSSFLNNLRDLSTHEAREGEAPGAAPVSGAVTLMSIHAAKGLEFPVVAVADLGRKNKRSGENPLILHDPAIGLVCQGRDQDGVMQSPASYLWGKWMLERMESTESKRLLYVACTRSADLLILSGKMGEKYSWIKDIMDAWQITPDDRQDYIKSFAGFELRVCQPAFQPVPDAAPQPRIAQEDGLSALPALAQPLPQLTRQRHMAVTHMQRALNERGEGMLKLRPVVRSDAPRDGSPRALAFLIGRVVHRLLANWEHLALSPAELESRLITFARCEGILQPQAVHHAVGRALHMLDNLRNSPLYDEIESASERYPELPFSLTTPIGQLHGILDLLFKHRSGNWNLIDWKTDWFPPANVAQEAGHHARQVAIYTAAARQTLGVEISTRTCFLAVQGITYRYTEGELADAWQAAMHNPQARDISFG